MEEARELCGIPFIKELIPLWGGGGGGFHPHGLILARQPLPTVITLRGQDFDMGILGDHEHSDRGTRDVRLFKREKELRVRIICLSSGHSNTLQREIWLTKWDSAGRQKCWFHSGQCSLGTQHIPIDT